MNITPLRPMKARRYNPNTVPKSGYLQPKLNGLRCLWNGYGFNSYNLEHWNTPVLQHIYDAMNEAGLTCFGLDGELYVHGKSLQWINSRAAVTRKEPHKESHLIEFHVFDIYRNTNSHERQGLLDRLFLNLPPDSPLKRVMTIPFNSVNEANTMFQLCRKEGYEGMIYRSATEPYGFAAACGNKENRWSHIMKRKFWEDMDATVLSIYEGKDGFARMTGGFCCLGENGVEFNVGGGPALTHESRRKYWWEPTSIVGRTVKVRYEMLSDGGVPLKPVVEVVY